MPSPSSDTRARELVPAPSTRLVAVAHPRDDIEAALVRNLLADAGIEAAVTGGSLAGFRAEAPADVCVVVRAADAEAARQALAAVRPEIDEALVGDDAPPEPEPPQRKADAPLPAKPRVFTQAHLVALLIVWYPLNPVVVAWCSAKFAEVFLRATLHVDPPKPATALLALTATILGPFTALLEGRNRLDCWRVALALLPWCAGPLVAAILLQWLWRPAGGTPRAVRLALFGLGIAAWLAGGLLSVLANAG